tara:strand:+ start:168 stop:386 length:219 start_codon:yes stop_codon:yes gene_type:complete
LIIFNYIKNLKNGKMVRTTKNYKVELKNDLLMIKDLQGNLLKAMVVPAFNAVEKFNEMVEKVTNVESNKKSK